AWDSTSVGNGTVNLTAVAYDAAGNSATSATVSVNVSNNVVVADTTPPVVSIASPSAGATSVSGTISVVVNATDNVGVTRVDLRVNGNTVGTGNAAPFQFSWDSTTVADGTATLTAAAYDAAGNSSVSSGVSISVANGTTTPPPNVADTTPPTL